jgi:hypothetical protein
MAASNRTDVDILDDFCTRSRVPSATEIIALLRSYAQKGRRSESNRVDLKECHADTPRQWAEICKDVVAMHNSGGGVLLFGVRDDGSRVGMATSIATYLDPANINNKLRRYHVSGQVRTSFVERSYYGKMYGFLFVHAGSSLIVFDSDLQMPDGSGKTETIARAGVLYVRRGSASAPARQVEVEAALSDLLGRGVRTFLARVEQVATLPATTQLIAQQPGAGSGYILTSAGYGVPVKVVGPDEGSNSIPLSEALLPDLPFADVNGEVIGQLRQFYADETHRVRASTLTRWYRQRSKLDLPNGAAEFLTISALDNRGFSGYWASRIPHDKLRPFVVDQVRRNS